MFGWFVWYYRCCVKVYLTNASRSEGIDMGIQTSYYDTELFHTQT